jgi:hypothetical protein
MMTQGCLHAKPQNDGNNDPTILPKQIERMLGTFRPGNNAEVQQRQQSSAACTGGQRPTNTFGSRHKSPPEIDYTAKHRKKRHAQRALNGLSPLK